MGATLLIPLRILLVTLTAAATVHASVFPASTSACNGLRSSCPGPQGLCCPLPAVCLSATQCYGIDVADFTDSNPIADSLPDGGVVPVLDPNAFPLPNVDLPPQSPGANVDDTYTSVIEQYLSSLTQSGVIESLVSALGGGAGIGNGNDITDIPLLATSLPSLTILTEDLPGASAGASAGASGSEGDGSVFVQTSTTAGAGGSGTGSTSTVRSTTQRSSATGSTSTVASESSGSESQSDATQTETQTPTQTEASGSASGSAAPTGGVGRVNVPGGGVLLALGVGIVVAILGL